MEAGGITLGNFATARNFDVPRRDTTIWMRSAYREATPVPAMLDDADLIAGLKAFEATAWDQLFEDAFPRIYKFAFVRTGDHAAAEDIASEVFEEAARRIGAFVYRGLPVRAWLYRIARNLTADHLTRKRRRPHVRLEDADLTTDSELSPLESLADINQAMQGLTRDQQEVVALRFVMGCDLSETAEATGKSVGAVKLLQHRALRTLRSLLRDSGEF